VVAEIGQLRDAIPVADRGRMKMRTVVERRMPALAPERQNAPKRADARDEQQSDPQREASDHDPREPADPLFSRVILFEVGFEGGNEHAGQRAARRQHDRRFCVGESNPLRDLRVRFDEIFDFQDFSGQRG
jgi:hypothetical protein